MNDDAEAPGPSTNAGPGPSCAPSSSSPSSTPSLARRKVPSKVWRLAAFSAFVAVLAAGVMVLPAWVPAWPRSTRRRIIEAVLRGTLFGYCGLFAAAVGGTPLMLGLALLSRRKRGGENRNGSARGARAEFRGAAFCTACLVALIALEAGSAAWRGWIHRFPSLPTTFPPASEREVRIVVLGGSSALGEPYRPWCSIGQIVAWKLQQAVPEKRFTCEVLAWLGDSLEQQHHKLAGLKHRPDIVIIYSGHNEFAARFEEERDPWVNEEPGGRWLRALYRATLWSPFCRLAYEVVSKNRLDQPPPLTGRHQLVDPPLCSPSEAADVLADFRGRLEAIVEHCERIGALPVLIVPPANEADYEPGRSTLPPDATQQERRRVTHEIARARAFEARGDWEKAETSYRAVLARHPDFAEAHFRLARRLEREGGHERAGRHYLAALDHDGLPIRCPAPLRAAIKDVARRHPRAILIDGRRVLAAIGPHGLIGDEAIQDTHHPTLAGQAALAGAVLHALAERGGFPQARGLAPPTAEQLAQHFAIDAARWAAIWERTSVHYRRVAGYRYDPAERLQKAEKCLALSRKYANEAREHAENQPRERDENQPRERDDAPR